jgi:hypothetical protein
MYESRLVVTVLILIRSLIQLLCVCMGKKKRVMIMLKIFNFIVAYVIAIAKKTYIYQLLGKK